MSKMRTYCFISWYIYSTELFYPVGSAVENDDFGDFAAFRTGSSPTQNHLSDDTIFTAFQGNTVLQVM